MDYLAYGVLGLAWVFVVSPTLWRFLVTGGSYMESVGGGVMFQVILGVISGSLLSVVWAVNRVFG